MDDNKSLEIFGTAPVRKAVLQNALPAMVAMLMVLVYNLADTFFIGQTHDDLQVAAVSLATPRISALYGSRHDFRHRRDLCHFPRSR